MNKDALPTKQDSKGEDELGISLMEELEDESGATFMEEFEDESAASLMDQLEEYLSEGEYDYEPPKRGDIHDGVVIEISDRGAIVDAGFKRDGIVPVSDLDRLDPETRKSIRPGDEIAVAVQTPQDEEGRLLLSIYQALVREDWEKAEEMMAKGELYEGEISGHNRGGLLVPFGRIRGFIPASHTVGMPRGLQGDERRDRLADMVGDKVGLKIIEVDRHRRRLILSQRQARRAWQRIQRKRVMEELTEGETARGTVTGITDFGAFVDLGGADGLIHISELSWSQVDDPREAVEVGDEVEVYVLSLDWDRTRIALSLKRLKPNPWSQVAGHYEVGQLAEGKVSRVLDFGAFVELGLGVEGLLHISEMTGASQLSPTEILEPGQKVLVKIIGMDTHKQRITLSARQVQREQWESWMAEHRMAQEEEAVEEPAEAPEAEETVTLEEVEEVTPEAQALVEEAPVEAEETTAPEDLEEAAADTEPVAEEALNEAEETTAPEDLEEVAADTEPVAEEALDEAEETTAPEDLDEAAADTEPVAEEALDEAEETTAPEDLEEAAADTEPVAEEAPMEAEETTAPEDLEETAAEAEPVAEEAPVEAEETAG